MAGCLIGTDEAGYGPNLGPLVISATRWDVPDSPAACDLWQALAMAVSPLPCSAGRLHLADSKQVYQPARGLAALERGVLALLALLGVRPRSGRELRRTLTSWPAAPADECLAAWYSEADVELPVAATRAEIDAGCDLLTAASATSGCRLQMLRSDVVPEARFNRLTDAAGSKGAVLTEATLKLAASCWSAGEATLVLCDKHGGRNTYSAALSAASDGAFVGIRRESREQSVYAVGTAEYRFETRAERHLPVAAASMVSKYVREVTMLAFNAWWQRHQPDVKPTKGYPGDAARFRGEIVDIQAQVGVTDDMLWRRR